MRWQAGPRRAETGLLAAKRSGRVLGGERETDVDL